MKKKILALCLVVALLATAIAGATLAYFSDTDAQTNTFTTGNVAIDLWEDFGENSGVEKLLPMYENRVGKEIYITNTGSEDAYVRYHFAIPQILDNGNPNFDASENVLHWNFINAKKDHWNFTKTLGKGYDENEWNYYEEEIDGIMYNIYVATYETPLAKDDVTPTSIYQVYLDAAVTNNDITAIKEELGDNWYILVAAEATQAEGFKDAFTALNTAFGQPAAHEFDWETIAAENKTFGDAKLNGATPGLVS